MKVGKYLNLICLIITLTLLINSVSGSDPKERIITNNGTPNETDASSQDLFELLFAEAKSFYVDGLVSAFYKDTSEAKYCFDRVFEIMAEISELDTLTLLQQDDFNRFYERVTSDFQNNFAYLSEDSGATSVAYICEEIFETVLDSVYIGHDTLIVLEDRPGHIPVVRSNRIDRIISYLTGRESRRFQIWLDNAGLYREHMLPILRQYNIPEEIFYLGLIESGFNANAYSYAHAAGPWQFIAGTGARYGLKRNWWVDERRDPIKSTHAAAKYLSKLYEEFNDWFLAMAAYNTGELRVWRAIRREGTRDYWKLRSLPLQTRNYVPTFMAGMIIAKNPEKYGMRSSPKETWQWEEVVVDRCYEFEDIARACSTTVDVIKFHNPELRRWMTPPNDNNYVLRVPVGTSAGLQEKLAKLPEPKDQKPEWITHRVKSGQTLNSIAKSYGTTVSALVAANNLRSRNQLRVGQTLMIPTTPYYASTRTSDTTVITHTVKRGETLSKIAENYNTSISKIRSLNNLYQDEIIPGQKLKIRQNTGAQSVPTTTPTGQKKIVHIVKKGDTLQKIAEKYNVSLSKIRSWNDIYGKKPIYPGQRIVIYKSAAG